MVIQTHHPNWIMAGIQWSKRCISITLSLMGCRTTQHFPSPIMSSSSNTQIKNAMARSIIIKPLQLTAALSHLTSVFKYPLSCRYRSLISQFSGNLSALPFSSSSYSTSRWFSNDSTANRCSELTRLPALLDGCDYEHWLVVMEPPKGYPLRDEIVHEYVKTLAIALGSEEEAKKSIYSVSTKYYYAFGCKIPENLTYKIKSLPSVRWVLPDSYLCHGENDYGGEPFVDGEVLPYDEKYHADWLPDQNDDKYGHKTRSRRARRKEKKEIIFCETCS